jgi:phytanoyl-CoA hydroxylase
MRAVHAPPARCEVPVNAEHETVVKNDEPGFTDSELAQFERAGYVIARHCAAPDMVSAIRAVADAQLAARVEPLELEADLKYPGAPPTRTAPGGGTVRRLLQAYQRDPVFAAWLATPAMRVRLRQLLGPTVLMPLAHHNCIMTKEPAYSSDSLWHQDLRYWHYAKGELVTTWLALGPEHPRNGGLLLIPGSHRLRLGRERFDDAQFLRTELPENQALIAQAEPAELGPGDVLFFHCRLLHAASRNYESNRKLAAVFTFRAPGDEPVAGTRSAGVEVGV